MAKDYAKRSTRRRKRLPRSNRRVWVWVGFLLGLSIVVWLLAKARPKLAHSSVVKVVTATKLQEATAERPLPPPEPTFDFYNVLAQGQSSSLSKSTDPTRTAVEQAPTDSNELADYQTGSASQAPAPLGQTDTSPQQIATAVVEKQLETELDQASLTPIVLVLATFKSLAKADQLQAQLLLQGLDAQIKTVHRSGQTLYQVYLGPYLSLEAAKRQQNRLQARQIKSMVVQQRLSSGLA